MADMENSRVEETKMDTEINEDSSKPVVSAEQEKDTATNGDSEKSTEAEKETGADAAASSKEKIDEKPVKPQGPKLLDLAFGMDCTGSMGSYIRSAQQGIRSIVEEIVSKEAADVRLALVEYRDHPPQDRTFVTRTHDFTKSVREMKGWLDGCSASGGGDGPEAVADALHQILKLSWRDEATKICVFISDAPPHGLDASGDGFPNGCPDGLDPMVIAGQLAEKGVTLYQVGCEPAINRYKEFFVGLAHVTGGQYVPLNHAGLLAKVIVGGAQEEMSLQQMMEQVNREVQQHVNEAGPGSISQSEISHRVHSKLQSYGFKSKQMMLNKQVMPQASRGAKEISYCTNMSAAQSKWKETSATTDPLPGRQAFSFSAGPSARTRGAMKKSAKKKEASPGMFGGLKKWAFGSKSEEKEGTAVDVSDSDGAVAEMGAGLPPPFVFSGHSSGMLPPQAASGYGPPPPMFVPAAPSGSSGLDYEVDEEADVGQEQVYRMVQKSIMQNQLASKIRRDSDGSN